MSRSGRHTELFQTPPTVSVTAADKVMLPRTPQKTRFQSRLSTPNVAIRITSPMLSPIPLTSHRTLAFNDSAKKSKRDLAAADNSFTRPPSSPLEKSYRTPLNDHLDLKLLLKEYDLLHLLPIFESKGITLTELAEMQEVDFIDLGIFQLHELDKLKRIGKLFNDSPNSSFY